MPGKATGQLRHRLVAPQQLNRRMKMYTSNQQKASLTVIHPAN